MGGEGKEVQEGGGACILMVDSHCCVQLKLLHNTVKQLSSNLKVNLKIGSIGWSLIQFGQCSFFFLT